MEVTMIGRVPMSTTMAALAATLMLGSTTLAVAKSASSSPTGFTPATAACMKQATADLKVCKFSSAVPDCQAQFLNAIANCFAAGKGATCATSCVTKSDSCDMKAKITEAKCKSGCKGSTDPTCKTTCTGNYKTAKALCQAAFSACLMKCPQLQ